MGKAGPAHWEVDDVPFTNVVHFWVECLQEPKTKQPINFPLRTVAEIIP
jgi:hypothetical protein